MRILHVDPERGFGGGEVQVLALLDELAARGHRSTLAADPDGRLALAAAVRDVDVRALRIANHLDLRAAFVLRRLAAGHDVVHFHTARAHAMAPFCRGVGARLVVTRRMDYVPRGGPYARFLYNRAVDVVVAISASVRAALVRGGVEPARIRVVPSGIDPARVTVAPTMRAAARAVWGIAEDDLLVLVPGALERRKGQDVLIAAVARLASTAPRVRVVLCGAGREAETLERLAAPLGRTVLFAGFRDDIGVCLAAADVVALPSRLEGLGVAALEAMAAGRALVASRVGGLAEVVVDGETGLLVPPEDPAALAGALGRLAADPALRARLGSAGRARVLDQYTSAKMAEGTLACYGEPR
jgi:glycosyltransferase involved in cell wall biosynthesis